MKAVMEKPEPVWRDFITDEGDRIKVRKLKVTYLFDMADFQDALSFDGATFDIFRPNEYAVQTGNSNRYSMPEESRQAMKRALVAMQDLLDLNEEKPTRIKEVGMGEKQQEEEK